MCRPEVICAYPISPQTHIVENLSQIVKAGELGRCEFVNVESEFAAMSVAIGASATGARAYTATASQGLLYMVEALYNASGLGLPIVMTVANRAIGAPINIWNDHSDSMSQRDCGWIQLYAETNQEALDLHIQAFRLAEELSTPVMVCMDGFILTHAVERIDIPAQEQVDAFLPPFEPRQVLDPDEPISIGAMVGPEAFMEVKYLAHAKQMRALELIPRDRRRLRRGVRARLGRAARAAIGRTTPRRSSSRSARCSARSRTRSTSCARRACAIGAVGITLLPPVPARALRAALAGAERVVVLEKALAVGIGGIVTANVRMALSGVALHGYTVIAGLGGRAITKASLRALFLEAAADALEPLTFLDMDWEIVNRELARMAIVAPLGSHAENMLRDAARSPRDRSGVTMSAPTPIRFYQTGSFAVGNRLLDPEQRSVQAGEERTNSITCGHRACQGCGEALGARYALDAAMRATGGQMIAANATGCLEVFSTPYPETSWRMPGSTRFRQRPGGLHRDRRRAAREGPQRRARGRPGRRRGHRRHRFRLPLGHVRAQRRRALHLLRQRGLHEHRRAALRRDAAGGADRDDAGRRAGARQRLRPGQERAADRDGARDPLRRDRHGRRAARPRGEGADGDGDPRRALPARLRPLPAGLGHRLRRHDRDRPPGQGDGIFPVFEARDGEVTAVSKIRRQRPVEDYLRPQERFAHLFKPEPPQAR